MPEKNDWDLGFRPESYWDTGDPLTALIQNVTGQMRREMITDIVTRRLVDRLREAGDPDADAAEVALGEVSPGLMEDVLDEAARTSLGWIHPQFMGGEYLPKYRRHEVEIARIVLDSVTMDVYSIRARRAKNGRIHYRIVDEYECDYEIRPKSSARPLTLGELTGLIDSIDDGNIEEGQNYLDAIRDANVDGGSDVERMRWFVTVTSPLYPGLEPFYEARAEAWAARRRAELGYPDEEEEEEEDEREDA